MRPASPALLAGPTSSRSEKAGREFVGRLAGQSPLLPGADVLPFVDIDSTQKRVYGYQKQRARFGQRKSRASRCCFGAERAGRHRLHPDRRAGDRRGPAARRERRRRGGFAAEAVGIARACGATGIIVARMDSAYYGRRRSPPSAAPAPSSPSPSRPAPPSAPRSRPSPGTPGPRSSTPRSTAISGSRSVSSSRSRAFAARSRAESSGTPPSGTRRKFPQPAPPIK
jgi:hypothetical protein